MVTLFSRATNLEALKEAWKEVSDRQDEAPPESISRFAEDVDEKLERLAEQLALGEYAPAPLWRVSILKESGEERVLHVPTVRDRIVERSVHDVIAPFVDPWLGPTSFAFRQGIGVADALQEVVKWRDSGFTHVLRSDIEDCFPTIPRHTAVRMLKATLPDRSLDNLIDALVLHRTGSRIAPYPPNYGSRRRRTIPDEVPGLPQGTSLSPLTTNLVLTQLDLAMYGQGFPIIRFADDFVVPVVSETDGWEAMRVATAALDNLDMGLSPEKTSIMSFEEGFTFLGEDLGPRFPPQLENHRVPKQTDRVVYVGNQGARVRRNSGRLIVESKSDEELLNVPLAHVLRIVLFGSVGLSAGVRSWALATGVDVIFLSRNGNYIGKFQGLSNSARIARLKSQINCSENLEDSMVFARAVIASKLAHQVTMLRRFPDRDRPEDGRNAIAQIQNCLRMIPDAKEREELMGLEGAAARVYFKHYGSLFPEELQFELRSRRPPADVANSALGYGYAVLLGECISALSAAGLDPAIGLLHSDEDGRPSLGLDLMEEFRPYVVDQVVLSLARRGTLGTQHERAGDKGGVLLTKKGKKVLIAGYEKRMLRTTAGALVDFNGSIRRHLYRQAQRLAAFIEDPTVGWSGLTWR